MSFTKVIGQMVPRFVSWIEGGRGGRGERKEWGGTFNVDEDCFWRHCGGGFRLAFVCLRIGIWDEGERWERGKEGREEGKKERRGEEEAMGKEGN